jgi:hypothetical protein
MKPKKGHGFDPIGIAKSALGLTDYRKRPDRVSKLVPQDPARARIQEAGGTFPRLALLATVSVGLLGAAALYGYLGLRLLLAAAMTLLLLLVAPAMLIAPALGESGRATFIAWGQRLIGAILAKLVFAIFLTVVLATGGVFTGLKLGWFGTWLLLGAFWWGVFLKRQELIGFVTAGTPAQESNAGGHLLSQGYYAWMLGRGVRQVGAAAIAPGRRGMEATRGAIADRREAQTVARAEMAGEHLDLRGRQALANEHAGAQHVVAQEDSVRRELRAVDRRLQGYDEVAVAARATGAEQPTPTAEQRHLLQRRKELRALLTDSAVGQATQLVRHGQRNQALTGEPVSRQDLDVFHARRARELESIDDPADPVHLAAAGIDPADYLAADAARRAELERASGEHLSRERALRAAASGQQPVGDTEWLNPDELRQRTAEHRARLRAERRQERARQGVYRRR